MEQRPNLSESYMEVAEIFAKRSYAKRRKVGAIIVQGDSIVGEGYNGTPAGWDNACEGADGLTLPHVVHAEQNALDKLLRKGIPSVGAVLFVTTAPCIDCAKRIHGARLNSVFYRDVYRSTDGLAYLEKAGVNVVQLKSENP